MKAPAASAFGQLMRRLAIIITLTGTTPAQADEIRPALLDIKEQASGLVRVAWKIPTRGNQRLAITPTLPAGLQPIGAATQQSVSGAQIEHSIYRNSGDTLAGGTITIDGLSALQTDVLLLIQLADGSSHSAILRPAAPSYTIPARASPLAVAADYWRLGTVHILEGVDHLLFVFALLLIVSGIGPLVKAVTAFTLAHSITLALATLGLVHVPAAPTEAVIALSILFLAAELVHRHQGRVGLTERRPWLIAFLFGLIHGLGFAGALSEIGVPENDVPLALLTFNLGVETGQLLFIAMMLSVIALARTLADRLPLSAPAGAWRIAPYTIGGIAAFWTIQRIMSFLPVGGIVSPS